MRTVEGGVDLDASKPRSIPLEMRSVRCKQVRMLFSDIPPGTSDVNWAVHALSGGSHLRQCFRKIFPQDELTRKSTILKLLTETEKPFRRSSHWPLSGKGRLTDCVTPEKFRTIMNFSSGPWL